MFYFVPNTQIIFIRVPVFGNFFSQPGISLLSLGGYVLLTRVRPQRASKGYSNLPLRLALADVERHLHRVCRLAAYNSNDNSYLISPRLSPLPSRGLNLDSGTKWIISPLKFS